MRAFSEPSPIVTRLLVLLFFGICRDGSSVAWPSSSASCLDSSPVVASSVCQSRLQDMASSIGATHHSPSFHHVCRAYLADASRGRATDTMRFFVSMRVDDAQRPCPNAVAARIPFNSREVKTRNRQRNAAAQSPLSKSGIPQPNLGRYPKSPLLWRRACRRNESAESEWRCWRGRKSTVANPAFRLCWDRRRNRACQWA